MFSRTIFAAAAIVALGVATVPTDASAYWRGGGWGWHGGGYGGGWHGGGWGYYGGGFAAGAIVGGLLAAPYYSGYYYGPPRVYYAPPLGGAVAYCMQRFRSYDPRTGTYLGYDGYRHPCP